MRQRKPNRRRDIDYTRPGFYFVTVCVQNRECLLGAIRDGTFEPNNNEEIVRRCWRDLPNHYPHCRLHEFVVMPNHVHGIIEITRTNSIVGAGFNVGTGLKPVPTIAPAKSNIRRHALSEIIRGFKTFSSRAINRADESMTFRWQRSFYDRVIRNKRELAAVTKYIKENPRHWMEDEENPWR